MFPQGVQSLFDLVERGAEGAEESAGLEGGTNLFDIVVWILHVEEERVGLSFVETLLDVAQFEVHARSESHALHIFPLEILHIRSLLIGCHASFGPNSGREGDRHGSGTSAGFHNILTGGEPDLKEGKADIFWIKNLRGARQIDQQIPNGGLQ